jgi:hypothetical protein
MSPRSSDDDAEVQTVRSLRANESDLPGRLRRSADGALLVSGKGSFSADHETDLAGLVVRNRGGQFDARVRFALNASKVEEPLLMLLHVTAAMDLLDDRRRDLVAECRRRGRSWADIASALGVTRQSAWDRYSEPDE